MSEGEAKVGGGEFSGNNNSDELDGGVVDFDMLVAVWF